MDLSGATSEVTSVTLTKTSVDTLKETVADNTNQVSEVEVKLTNAAVVFDGKALDAISEQAKGDDLRLVVDDTDRTKLAEAQKETLSNYNVATTFEAYMESNGERIHDFKGSKAVGKGKCTVCVYARNGYAKKISVTVK